MRVARARSRLARERRLRLLLDGRPLGLLLLFHRAALRSLGSHGFHLGVKLRLLVRA